MNNFFTDLDFRLCGSTSCESNRIVKVPQTNRLSLGVLDMTGRPIVDLHSHSPCLEIFIFPVGVACLSIILKLTGCDHNRF